MTIRYIGKSGEIKYRCADINYDESTEEEEAMQLVAALEESGYECYCEQECISVIMFDYEEYKNFVSLYKKLKKMYGLR